MKQQVILLAVIVVLSAGCASTPTDSTISKAAVTESAKTAVATERSEDVVTAMSTEDEADRVVCRQITPTGSHRKKMVCRTVRDIKRDRQAAQDALRKRQGASMVAPDDT